MPISTLSSNESERLDNLREYRILDSIPEQDFDDITMLASEICDSPISMVSLIDENRQWFKSNHGLDVKETPREFSICAKAIQTPNDTFTIRDLREDNRFKENPYVVNKPNLVFYAGIPLLSPEGFALGTLCVLDIKPKTLSTHQLLALKVLSHQVMAQFELRRKNAELSFMYEELETKFREIEQFAYIAAHDLKSPLNNIRGLVNIILNEGENTISEDNLDYLNTIKNSSLQLAELIEGILEYSKVTQLTIQKKEYINLNELFSEIIQLLNPPENIILKYNFKIANLRTSKKEIKQILINLINNAIKYLDKPNGIITISVSEIESEYHFSVSDNGAGITIEHLQNIFDLFKMVKLKTNSGTGIGLAIVKKLVNKLKGVISVTSNNNGTSFIFTIKK